MDLWLKLEQARNDNYFKIAKLEKMIDNKKFCGNLPQFLRPQIVLEMLRYDELENTMYKYQSHFKRKINSMEIELGLDGWKILLEYCIANNKPLEKISNIDMYCIKHPINLCLEDDEIYNVPISYQKNKIYRKIINLLKNIER